MKRNIKKWIAYSSVLVCLIVCGTLMISWIRDERKIADAVDFYEELQEEHTSVLGSVNLNAEELIQIPVDFEALYEVNEDIYAWIDIEDTNVHYPILQHAKDDSYYLEHTVDRVAGLPGSIYTEKVNAKDFSDYITLVYGHDMRDGSMFKHLHKFSDEEFFKEHDVITIYTENKIYQYRVYAAVAYDNRHIMYSFDKDDPADRESFIQSLHDMKNSRNQYRDGMEVDENSKLLVLSTCITGQPDKRWIVVSSLIE